MVKEMPKLEEFRHKNRSFSNLKSLFSLEILQKAGTDWIKKISIYFILLACNVLNQIVKVQKAAL